MTHNEKRVSWWKEGIAGLFSGIMYGSSNAIVGHPFDTIKTKMQVLDSYKNSKVLQSIKHLYTNEGVKGFYKGCTPALIASSIYRGVQFATFEALYTKWEKNDKMRKRIPFAFGLEIRVVAAGAVAGFIRAIIECPFEYLKVKRQTNQIYALRNAYQGFNILTFRSMGILVVYFSSVDSFRRNTNLYSHQYGIFVMNGFCSVLAWLLSWPLELAKNHVQAASNVGTNSVGSFAIIQMKVKEEGVIRGLFRGCLPGLTGVFIRSGFAMIVMLYTQRLITYMGLRNI
jgi:solute carrier family 25 carnitine/acylcarnitine transporter 20/29